MIVSNQKDFFKRSAFLRREEIGVTKVSRRFFKENPKDNHEIYVFDSGVIDMYQKPWDRGATRGKMSGLGHLLPILDNEEPENFAENQISAERLTDIQVQYLFKLALKNGSHILSTPFHYEEIERQELYLTERVGNLGYEKSGTNLRRSIQVQRQLALISSRFRDGNKEAAWEFAKSLALARFDRKSQGFSRDVLAFDRMCRMATQYGTAVELKQQNFLEYVKNADDQAAVETIKNAQVFENLAINISSNHNNQPSPDSWSSIIAIAQSVMRSTFETRHKVPEFVSKKINDTNSLAWVFILNTELVRLNLQRYRVVLVSDDINLCEIAYAGISKGHIYNLIGKDVSIRYPNLKKSSREKLIGTVFDYIFPNYSRDQALGRDQFNSSPARYFSLNFVRHVWGYFGDCIRPLESLEVGKSNESPFKHNPRFSEIFKGIFADIEPDQSFRYYKALEKIARDGVGFANSNNRMIHDATDKLKKLSESVIAKQEVIDAEASEPLKNSIVALIEDHVVGDNYNWDNLAFSINEELSRDRDRALVSLSTIGANTLRQSKLFGTRHPPDLIFDSLQNTMEIFRKLSIRDSYDDGEQFLSDFENIKLDCWSGYGNKLADPLAQDDRQEVHLKFLVLGAAFASADKWSLALANAKRAIEIIKRQSYSGSKIKVRSDHEEFSGKKSFMSGREAYYLLSVAQRIVAHKSSELEASRDSLVEARKALLIDKRKGTASSILPIRFDAEDLALDLSSYYLKRFNSFNARSVAEEWELINAHDESFERVETSFYTLVTNLKEQFDIDLLQENELLMSEGLGKITSINIAVNILQVLVIARFRALKSINLVDQRLIIMSKNALRTLEFIYSEEKNSITKTQLTKSYWMMGELICNPKDFYKNGLQIEIKRLLTSAKDNSITIYDAWRYKNLLQLSGILISLDDM